jgi:hypothetical protein
MGGQVELVGRQTHHLPSRTHACRAGANVGAPAVNQQRPADLTSQMLAIDRDRRSHHLIGCEDSGNGPWTF